MCTINFTTETALHIPPIAVYIDCTLNTTKPNHIKYGTIYWHPHNVPMAQPTYYFSSIFQAQDHMCPSRRRNLPPPIARGGRWTNIVEWASSPQVMDLSFKQNPLHDFPVTNPNIFNATASFITIRILCFTHLEFTTTRVHSAQFM